MSDAPPVVPVVASSTPPPVPAANTPSVLPTAPPAPPSVQPLDQGALAAELAEIRQDRKLTRVGRDLGLNSKQAESVVGLMDKHGLQPEQARVLAQSANPDLFKVEDPADFPATHASARPGVGVPAPERPAVDVETQRWEKIRAMPNSRVAGKYIANELGHWAAEAVGMGHRHERLAL